SLHGSVTRRVRRPIDESRRHVRQPVAPVDGQVESELRAVRRPAGTLRRRLPLGHGARELRVLDLDGLAQHEGGRRPARGAGGRGQGDGGRLAVPRAGHDPDEEGPDDRVEQRPLPARRRPRPEHLRDRDALTNERVEGPRALHPRRRYSTYLARFASEDARPRAWSSAEMPGGTFSARKCTSAPPPFGASSHDIVIVPSYSGWSETNATA